MFPVVAVVSSIPVFSIVVKYNMIENGFSPTVGFLWGVVFPWVVAFPLYYMPGVLAQFINFSSLFFVAFTDFILPFALYVTLQRLKHDPTLPGDRARGVNDAPFLADDRLGGSTELAAPPAAAGKRTSPSLPSVPTSHEPIDQPTKKRLNCNDIHAAHGSDPHAAPCLRRAACLLLRFLPGPSMVPGAHRAGDDVHAMSEDEEHAFPEAMSPFCRKLLAVTMGVALTVLALGGVVLAFDQDFIQGSFSFDAQACALVGN